MAITTINATMQVRQGNEADLDVTQLLVGEWALSVDKRYIRICVAQGIALRMATYEAFEEDMELVQTIVAECETIEQAVQAIESRIQGLKVEVERLSQSASESSLNALNHANKAEEFSQSAETSKAEAKESADTAKIYEENSKAYKDLAEGYKNTAVQKASDAEGFALSASASATEATTSAGLAVSASETATQKAQETEENADLSKSYAVGGTGTRIGEDTDNSKYYAEQSKYWAEQSESEAKSQSNWNETDTTKSGYILNKPFHTLGENFNVVEGVLELQGELGVKDYTKLDNKPAIENVKLEGNKTASDLGLAKKSELFSGSYNDLTDKPDLFSGDYNDLENKPDLFSGAYDDLTGKPDLKAVATSGSYDDLSDKPTLFSGDYRDLSNKPTGNDIGLDGYEKAEEYTEILPTDSVMNAIAKLEARQGGSANSTIQVTVSESLIGGTITCVNGAESYTKSVDSTLVEFSVKNFGTYTITVNKQGSEYSATVDVTYIGLFTCTIDCYGFGMWLEKGRVTKSFSSLEEILADQTTLRQLMTIHASADYMLEWLQNDEAFRSALLGSDNALKWIGLRDYTYDKIPSDFLAEWLAGQYWKRALKDHVPIMTSNTAPYGEASASAEATNQKAFNAMNGDYSTLWGAGAGVRNAWIQYKFVNPVCVKKIKWVGDEHRRIETYKIQASNDGTSWTDISPTYTVLNNSGEEKDIDNPNYYLYYRFNVITASDNIALKELQFYGRSLNVSSNGVGTLPPQTEPKVTIGGITYWTNKSEREFAEGSTIKYLYDHGVELEPLEFTKTGSSVVEKGNDYIIVSNSSTSWDIASLYTNNKINFTNKSVFRLMVTGGSSENESVYGNIAVYDLQFKQQSQYMSFKALSNVIYGENPNNVSLDIGNLNGLLFPHILNVASGSSHKRKIEVSEWWLE